MSAKRHESEKGRDQRVKMSTEKGCKIGKELKRRNVFKCAKMIDPL